MNRRKRFRSPVLKRRLAMIFLLIAAILALTGALMRETRQPGSSGHSLGYVFDALAWLIAFAFALTEARSADLFFQIAERAARRRAIGLAMFGLTSALFGCYLASFVLDRDAPAMAPALANAMLVAGAGAFLAGLFSLGWFYGGGYAARKVERLSEEEW